MNQIWNQLLIGGCLVVITGCCIVAAWLLIEIYRERPRK